MMHYINSLFTYLLTYTLNSHSKWDRQTNGQMSGKLQHIVNRGNVTYIWLLSWHIFELQVVKYQVPAQKLQPTVSMAYKSVIYRLPYQHFLMVRNMWWQVTHDTSKWNDTTTIGTNTEANWSFWETNGNNINNKSYLIPNSAENTITNACWITSIRLVQAGNTGRWNIPAEINNFNQNTFHFYAQLKSPTTAFQ